jgi:hypothetical protein
MLGRKTLAAVIDGKADAGLGRGIGVTDRGCRKSLAQAIEHGLVGDLAGQADIARRKAEAAPLISSLRQCDGVPEICVTPRAQPRDMIGERLAGLDNTIEPPPMIARRKICRPP